MSASIGRSTVPISNRILQAFPRSNAGPALGLDDIEVVTRQVCDTLLVDIMLYAEEIAPSWGTCKRRLDDIFADLDVRRQGVQVVLGIEVEVDTVIAQLLHISLATRSRTTLRVGRTHVGRVFANDVGNGALVVSHLFDAFGRADGIEGVVGPGVGGDLVAFGNHALDQGWVWCGRVDSAFSKIIACDEESGAEAVGFEDVEELRGVKIGTVVVSQGNDVLRNTIVDVGSVRDRPGKRARVIGCRRARWNGVRVAGSV